MLMCFVGCKNLDDMLVGVLQTHTTLPEAKYLPYSANAAEPMVEPYRSLPKPQRPLQI